MRAAVAAGSSTSGKFLAVPAIRFHIPKQQPAKGGSSRPQEGAAKGGPHQKNLISRSKGSNSRSEGGRSKRSPQRSSSSKSRQAGKQVGKQRRRETEYRDRGKHRQRLAFHNRSIGQAFPWNGPAKIFAKVSRTTMVRGVFLRPESTVDDVARPISESLAPSPRCQFTHSCILERRNLE